MHNEARRRVVVAGQVHLARVLEVVVAADDEGRDDSERGHGSRKKEIVIMDETEGESAENEEQRKNRNNQKCEDGSHAMRLTNKVAEKTNLSRGLIKREQ